MPKRRGVLLTRRSSFQYYCANRLWERDLIDLVIFESGTSYPENGIRSMLAKARRAVASVARSPASLISRISLFRSYETYFGNRAFHDRRILGDAGTDPHAALRTADISDVNAAEVIHRLRAEEPELVFVFGTRLIKPALFEGIDAPFLNMHWGWSPDYRGEGIVTALALEGPGALGVTVHLLSAGIDSGDILAQSRPVVDGQDNFYSIGLKLTVLGTDLLTHCAEQLLDTRSAAGRKQDLTIGAFRGTAFLRRHPEIYRRAWRNLRKATSAESR